MEQKNRRRNFIKSTILVSGTGIAAPNIMMVNTTKPITVDNTIVGHGDFKYRVDKQWGVQDPYKVPINHCHEMVLDAKGRILMTTTGKNNDNIIIYDRSGKVLGSWGRFSGAHGLTIAGEGSDQFLLITDPDNHQVYKTALDGRIIMKISRPKEIAGYEKDKDFKPTETTVAPNGDIYITDGYGKDFIIQYNAQGEYIGHFGGKGDGEADFDCAHGITVDHRDANNPTLLITSRTENKFKRFTLDGEHIETISLPGCWVCRPVIKGDYLYAAVIVTKTWSDYDGMLVILDKDNKAVSFPGGNAPEYKNDSLKEPIFDGKTFLNPHDVMIDNDENLYVPQWYSGRTYPIKLHRV